jgi:hypothetical protein
VRDTHYEVRVTCCRFVISGLIWNPVLLPDAAFLDAGSVIPGLIRDRHGDQKIDDFLNYDTAAKAGTQFAGLCSPLCWCMGEN